MSRRWLFAAPLLLALAACDASQMAMPATGAAGCDTRFEVANITNLPVRELYFSPSAQGQWGRDQLGTSMIPAGGVMRFVAANAGNYDFRAVMTNGRTFDLYRVNVCAASRITVTAGGLRAS
jgi:hypothetical protein